LRLVRIQIYGFGHLQDEVYEFPDRGIAVLYGPNESGKSTILEFIRAILYGFDSSKAKARYEPIYGGKFGGRLVFQMEPLENRQMIEAQIEVAAARDGSNPLNTDGVITVERVFSGRSLRGDVKVLNAHGNVIGTEEEMQSWLQPVSPQVFKSVFAFGLGELEDLQSLSAEDIQARIHSAGMGMKNVSPIELERRLEQKKLTLYRKRGQEQPISKLVREKQELKKKIQQLTNMPNDYMHLQKEYQQLRQRLEEWQEKKRQVETLLDTYTTYAAVRQLWEEITPLQKMLESYPDLPLCSNATYFAWQEQVADKNGLEQKVSTLKQQLQDLERALGQLKDSSPYLKNWQEILELYETRNGISDAKERIQRLEWEIGQLREKLQELQDRIGVRNLADDIQKARVTMGDYEALRRFSGSHQEIREQLTTLSAQLEQFQKELEWTEQEHAQTVQTCERIRASLRYEKESIPKRITEVQRLQKQVYELDALRARRQEAERRYIELREKRTRLQERITQQKARTTTAGIRSVSLPVLLLVVAMGVFLAAWLLPGERTGLILAGCITGLLAGILYRMVRRSSQMDYQGEPEKQEADPVFAILQTFERDMQELGARIEEATRTIRNIANALGMSLDSDNSGEWLLHIGQFEADLQRERHDWDEYAHLQERLRELSHKQERIQTILDKTNRAFASWSEKRETWNAEWQTWLQEHHAPLELTPESAHAYLQTLERIREFLHELQSKCLEQERIQAHVESYMQRLMHVLQATSDDVRVGQDDWLIHVQTLYEQAQHARMEAAKRSELEQRKQELLEDYDQLRNALEQKESEIKKWLSEHGFQDPIDVQQSYEWTMKREQTEQQLQLLYAKMEAKIGTSTLDPDILQTIREHDVSTWQRRADEALQELQQIQNEIAEWSRQQGKLELEMEQMERSTELGESLQRISMIDARLQELADEWATYTLAQKLLEHARKRYEKERQPAVLKQASVWFQMITDSRYHKVISPFEGDRLEVVAHDQTQLPTTALSRGTAEQLYLTMRFALIDELAEKGIYAPIVMDDVFVNFDPERLRMTIHVLDELAKRHQVLYLTCHPHIVETIQTHSQSFEVVSV
jgi:uncharacterized protein YhaN